MDRELLREGEIETPMPNRVWGEMAVVADLDDDDDDVADEDLPETIREPKRPPVALEPSRPG